jgi:hypothetical protein
MLTFFFFSALVIAALTFGAVVFVPLMLVGLAIWLILLPLRLVFAFVGGAMYLAFGIVRAIFALIFAPFRLLRRFA